MTRVLIISAKRTPIAPKHGALKAAPFFDLAACAIKALLPACPNLEAYGVRQSLTSQTKALQALIAGNALGAGGNPARLMALAAGLPAGLPAMTIDTQCCSGLDAIGLAFERLTASPVNQPGLILAGGAESASLSPIRINRLTQQAYEEAPFTPWPDRNPSMLDAAIDLERSRGLSHKDMLDWLDNSLQRVRQPSRSITPCLGVEEDRQPPTLSPALIRRAAGRRPYNPLLMAPLADGAAFVALSTQAHSIRLDDDEPFRLPLEVLSYGQAGSDPALPGLSCQALAAWLGECEQRFEFDRKKMVVSLMESFVAQVLANVQDLGLDPQRVNPWGGLLTRGHPVGASGAVLVCDLFDHLGPGEIGLALIPAAGGLASGLLVRRLNAKTSGF